MARIALLAIGFSDDPVPADKPRRNGSAVADGDGVREHIAIPARIGLIGNECGAGFDGDIVFFL